MSFPPIRHPFYPFYLFYPFHPVRPFCPLKSRARNHHFFENFIDFSTVENFFELSTSYQQCGFFDAVFRKTFGGLADFRHFCSTLSKLHNTLRNKEIMQKWGEINSATVASLRKFGVEVVEKLSTIGSFLGES